MALEFQSVSQQESEVKEEPKLETGITVVEADDTYGKFAIEPLEQGYGMTLGNPLRRVLYGSLQGTAVTSVRIEGVLHEYATIPHVKEEVSEVLLNIKSIRLRSEVDRSGKLRLEVAGEGEVCAGDIMASSDYEVVNPEIHLATLDSNEARLAVELNVERGNGYAAAGHEDGLPIGVLPLDAIFTPIRKVNYTVERTRAVQGAGSERLLLEIWTDGSIAPIEALQQAGEILYKKFFLFANTQEVVEEGPEGTPIALRISPENYNVPVERLELSSRTLNCLKRASVDRVGQILGMKKSELLQIRNFGEKSLAELYGRLREMDLMPPDLDPDVQEALQKESEEKKEAEEGTEAVEVGAESEPSPEASEE